MAVDGKRREPPRRQEAKGVYEPIPLLASLAIWRFILSPFEAFAVATLSIAPGLERRQPRKARKTLRKRPKPTR